MSQKGLLALVLHVCASTTASAWWDQNWTKRVKLTLLNGGQPENLANFPVLVRLDSSRINYGDTQNAGQDVRFVDDNDTTLLAHEIEVWNENGSSYVWVNVPQIDQSSNTDFIWMYYGNASVGDGQNAAGVWNGYEGVRHLREDPSGAAPQMKDSTVNAKHGTAFGGMTAANQVPGKIDGALNLDGTDDYVGGTIGPRRAYRAGWFSSPTTPIVRATSPRTRTSYREASSQDGSCFGSTSAFSEAPPVVRSSEASTKERPS